MKKFLALFVATAVTLSSAVAFAAPNRPSFPGNNRPSYENSIVSGEDVLFFISRWGVQWDSAGNVETRDTSHFSDQVGESKLNQRLNNNFHIVIGDTVTEADIEAYLEGTPQESNVFKKLEKEYKKQGALLYTSSGTQISWNDFNSDSYEVQWYVLKRELDGWHVDGIIIEKETEEKVDIVLPNEKEEYEESIDNSDNNPSEGNGEDTEKDHIIPDENGDKPTDTGDNTEDNNPTEEDKDNLTGDEDNSANDKDAEDNTTEEDKDNKPAEEDKDDEDEKEEDIPQIPDTSIQISGANYAYIFGYEPVIISSTDEDGQITHTAEITMGMDDDVTVEQVSSMLVRILDQNGNTKDMTFPMTDNVRPHQGQWYERGLLYLCSVGGFDENETIRTVPISRGQVAKLVACALNLNRTEEAPFNDVADSEYKEYIDKVYAYRYMNGLGDGSFAPEKTMTRAEFCTLFNNILNRDALGLTAIDEDGNPYEITAEDYYFIDMDPDHWAYEICLKATSAYDIDGFVDIVTRNSNIRNIIDQYDSQKIY